MPKRGANDTWVTDYDSCKTIQEIDQEFLTWAYDTSMGKFCNDKGLVYKRGETDALYITEQNVAPKKFYSYASDTGIYYYYFGTDTALRDEIKKQKHAATIKKREMRIQSSLNDIHDTLNAGKAEIVGRDKYTKEQKAEIQAFANDISNGTLTNAQKVTRADELNKKYGTNFTVSSTAKEVMNASNQTTGGFVNQVTQEWKNGLSLMEGRYIQSDDSRVELQRIIDGKSNGAMTQQQVNDAIWVWNQKYGKDQGIEIKGTASVKDMQKVMNKKNGILSITGEDIEKGVKELGNLSDVWNTSSNDTIQAFTKAGIDGDTMWGVITGKYNKDDKARQELLKLQKDIKEDKLTPLQARERVDKLNHDYNLGLNESVTAEDITKVIDSNQQMSYKRTVSNIAKQIIENKLNEQLNDMLEKKLGGTLKSLGINFSFKDRDTLKDIIDIIRGQKYVKFNEAQFLQGLQKQLEKKIDDLIVKKINEKVDDAAKKVNAKIDAAAKSITNKLDAYRKNVDSLGEKITKWQGEMGKLQIAEKLDSLIKSPVDKIANILNAPDKLLGKIGLNLGLGTMFKEITQVYTKGLAEKIHKVFQPALNKALAMTKKVSESIKKVIDAVNKLRDRAKQLVEKWKNAIKDAVKKQTQKLVNEIVKYVKLNITSSIGGGFKI